MKQYKVRNYKLTVTSLKPPGENHVGQNSGVGKSATHTFNYQKNQTHTYKQIKHTINIKFKCQSKSL